MEICNLKKGMPINWKHGVWSAVDLTFVNPGKGSAFYRVKLRNVDTGQVVENTFKSGEMVDEAEVNYVNCQYMYNDGSEYHFMDQTSFEQFGMTADTIGSFVNFMTDGMDLKVVFVNGKAASVVLPPKLVFTVKDAPPGVKGDSATGKTMPAIIETGATIQVPLFVKTGDKIRVSTEKGEYVERVQ
jgi:elongation factor P